MNFPFKKYNKNELLYDFFNLKKLLNNELITKNIKRPLTGYKSSNNFFQKERMRIKSQGKISAIEYWKKNQEYINEYKKKTLKTNDFSIITFLSFAPSQFSPYVSGMIYKYFNAKNVYDPYAGWGDRCVGAMALGINYIGCDSNKRLKPCFDKLINFFDEYSYSEKIEIYFQKSETLKIPRNTDLIFTSPPFFSEKGILIEEYDETEIDYLTFMKESLIPLFKNNSIWICLYIPKNMYKVLKKSVGPCKLKLTFDVRKNNMNGKISNSNIIYCWKN